VASATDDSGSVALADLSSDGTCWFVWRSQMGTWFGARTGGGSCSAQQVQQTPSPAPVSDTSIGWQQGSFPAT